MTQDPDGDRLADLEERLAAAKAARGAGSRQESKYTAASLAWRMVVELVVGMALGVGIGYGLDSLFGTLPLFLIVFALLGFAAGIRTMMRTADEVANKRSEGALLGGAPDETQPRRED